MIQKLLAPLCLAGVLTLAGCALTNGPGNPFFPSAGATFILVPDTQTYAQKFPEILNAQTAWIARQANEIDLVLQQGDLTQNNSREEWQRVQNAFSGLNHKVPYVLAVGNHDMGSAPGKFADTRNTTLFNEYFPRKTMAKLPGFGGVFEEGKMDNAYYLLETGDYQWLVLTLEFGPRNAVLDWANKIVESYPERTVIVNTHAYMYSDATRQGEGDYWRAQGYGVGAGEGHQAVNDGEQIWEKLIRKHPNIRFVFSGHILNDGEGTLVSINDAGYPVYQFLANYQEGVKGSENGGNGWLRILRVNFEDNSLSIKTYSPWLDKFSEDPAHSFEIKHFFMETAQ